MDFMNRGAQPTNNNRPAGEPSAAANVANQNKDKKAAKKSSKWLNIGSVALLSGIVLLALALVIFSLSKTSDEKYAEARLVNTDKMQAVFLTNGQVYFGNIQNINDKYINLTGIYFLTTQDAQPSNSSNATAANNANSSVALQKLGCAQLHYPDDQMIIQRQQVSFWENLNSDGQVAKAVAQYKTENPNGPDCSAAQAGEGAATTPSTNNNQ